MKTIVYMKSQKQTAAEAAFTGLPSDLSLWLDKTSLVSLVLEAVQEQPWTGLTERFKEADGEEYRPQMLATLLTYCYATSLSESQQIEENMGVDSVIRYLCAGDRPGWQMLIRFRRACRPLLERALARVLERAWDLRMAQLAKLPEDRSSYMSVSLGRFGGQLPRPDFAKLAERRVQAAVLLDSVDRDV